MKQGTAAFLAKAVQAGGRSRALLDSGDPDGAAGRAFYAMLYAALALLNEEGVRVRAHRAVCDGLAKRYVDTGRLDPRFHRNLAAAVARRRSAEAEPDGPAFEDAQALVEHAAEFLDEAATVLGIESDGC